MINTDVCFNTYYELAGCGGILRYYNGNWVSRFSCTVRAENNTQAYCWALLKAIQWAWTMGYKKVCFQLGTNYIVEWIKNPEKLSGPIREAVEVCRNWLNEKWSINFSHISQEYNKVADFIAKIARNKRCDWIEFREVPEECRNLLLEDIMILNTSRS